MIVAVDGPAGAGKSTVAKILAKRLGFLYIDTGAMYRALTLKALEEKIDIKDEAGVTRLAERANISLENESSGAITVFLDGRDVSRQIREPQITRHVSDVARIKGVREVLVGLQRALASKKNSVMDGRDIGTVVFPSADKKFYLDAAMEERIGRRYKELKELGEEVTRDDVASDLLNRDKIDSTREYAPLKRAEDAAYIDTTKMTIEEVVDAMVKSLHDG